jgi:hypothetical protein
MSNIISNTLFSLSLAAVASVSVAAHALSPDGPTTLAQNEQAARNTIVQSSTHPARSVVVGDWTPVAATAPSLAGNESAASRAIVDAPVSRGAQAVDRSRGQHATLSRSERAARRVIAGDANDHDTDEAFVTMKRVTTR